MGGAATAVSDDTRNVYVEAAFWWPDAIAGRARRFGFSTDAGHRFERGVDPASTVAHIERITKLIVEICGGRATRCGPVDDHVVNLPTRMPVTLRIERAAKVIGIPLTAEQCEAVMRKLGLPCARSEDRLVVTPPTWRFDLQIEEDLIEEVIRVLGYDALPAQPPFGSLTPLVQSEAQREVDALREHVAALGYRETVNFSFVEERLGARPRRQRRSDPRAESDLQLDDRHALQPDGQPARRAEAELVAPGNSREGVRSRTGLSARRVGRRRAGRRGRRAPADAHRPGSPTARPSRCSGASGSDRSTSSMSRAMSKRSARRPSRHSFRRLIRRCILAAARGSNSAAGPSATSVNCTRSGASSSSCRARRSSSSWTSQPCRSAPCRPTRRCRASSRCGATSQ